MGGRWNRSGSRGELRVRMGYRRIQFVTWVRDETWTLGVLYINGHTRDDIRSKMTSFQLNKEEIHMLFVLLSA